MTNPANNRLHDYEVGWLTLLDKMGIATDAMQLVATRRHRNMSGQFGIQYDYDGDREVAASQTTTVSRYE